MRFVLSIAHALQGGVTTLDGASDCASMRREMIDEGGWSVLVHSIGEEGTCSVKLMSEIGNGS